jgi:Amino acid synthesis
VSVLVVRKLVVQVEETRRELDREVEPPVVKVVAAAVIQNPFAGGYVEDLSPLYELGAEVAELLAGRAVRALGVEPAAVEAYGKGAIVGIDGELEHAAAVLHPRFGAPVRAAVERGEAIIPSTKKVGGPGSVIVMPLTNKNDIWSFDQMDAAEISVPDAPRPDEMLVCLTLAVGGRPLHRVTKPT